MPQDGRKFNTTINLNQRQ